jgi:SH3 domain-containing YSC84-like protein 1
MVASIVNCPVCRKVARRRGSLRPACSVYDIWLATLKQSKARKGLVNQASPADGWALSFKGIETMRKTTCLLFTVLTAALGASPANETTARLERSAAVLKALTSSAHGIPPEKLAASDCIAVVPRFKKGAAVVGVGFGKGFISCRTSAGWSAPGSITVETTSLGVQLGGEEIDLVVLSLDKDRRAKLLSERFTLGSDASAAWGNGKTAHEDPNAKILVYARTKGAFAGFGLDGATLKPDDSGNKALYGRAVTNHDIVEENPSAPPATGPLMAALPPR